MIFNIILCTNDENCEYNKNNNNDVDDVIFPSSTIINFLHPTSYSYYFLSRNENFVTNERKNRNNNNNSIFIEEIVIGIEHK